MALFFLAWPLAAWSDPNKPYDADYANGAGRKLERGVSNATMGWMEIGKEMTNEGKSHGVLAGCLWGPVKGLGQALVRTTVGVYETATFPLGTHPTFTPLVQPEFVLDKNGATQH